MSWSLPEFDPGGLGTLTVETSSDETCECQEKGTEASDAPAHRDDDEADCRAIRPRMGPQINPMTYVG